MSRQQIWLEINVSDNKISRALHLLTGNINNVAIPVFAFAFVATKETPAVAATAVVVVAIVGYGS